MKKIAIAILVAMAIGLIAMAITIIFCSAVSGQDKQQPAQNTLFFQAIEARMKILEQNYLVKFDPNWVVREKVIFVVPKDRDPVQRKNFGAKYHSDSQYLFFKEAYLDEEIKLSDFEKDIAAGGEVRNRLRELLDHELGHVVADHLSRELGKGPWPNIKRFRKMNWEAKQGINIISEGIGSFFGHTSVVGEIKISDEFFPEKIEGFLWQDEDYQKKIYYDGGHWLVRPIISQFGERGMIYLITHPFVLDDNVRASAHRYQEKAIEKLSQK